MEMSDSKWKWWRGNGGENEGEREIYIYNIKSSRNIILICIHVWFAKFL